MDLLELVARITLDKSEYEQGLSDMQSDVQQKQASMQKGMLTIAGAGAAALGAFAVSSVKTGAEFDQAMSQVAATMGKTVDEIGELRDFAMEMGGTTVFSATQSAEALNYMALAGYDAEKSMTMLPNVLNLAAAGAMDLARASDMVTDAESALGLEGEEVKDFVDQLAKTASKSNTSVEQLGEAMLTIGGTAQLMSGGTDRLATVLGLLADNGIKGSEAGTHLRNMILKLSAPTEAGAKAMDKLGLKVFDSEGKMRDMQDIITDLNTSMSNLTDEEKIQIIADLFNERDIAAVNALLGTTTERWDELGTAIVNSKDAAGEMAGTQLDNLAGDVTLLKSAWEGLQIQLSDKLTPTIRDLISGATWLIENFEKIAPIVLGAAAAFGTFAVAINIGNIIKSVTTAFTAFNAILAANPIGLVVAAVVGLGVALTTLWNTNDEFREKVTAAWDKLKTSLDSLKTKFETVKNKIVLIVEKLKGIFDFQWEMPHIKLPHFTWSWNDLGIIKIPNISVEWYKKAYDQPYMFSKPTLAGFGDGAGDEMVYGKNSLMNDIKNAMQSVYDSEQPVTIILQSVLDGKVIGETSYNYIRGRERARA